MGHYKAASFDPELLALHACTLLLAAQSGLPLNRLGKDITVLLEQICGNNFVHKLRAISLFEAGFNWRNKLIFAKRMMWDTVEQGLISQELFAKKGSYAIHAIMYENFFCDISKVLYWAAALNCVDLGNCYDRVAHPSSSIILRAWGIHLSTTKVILVALQTMQFCLRTRFGESTLTYGGTADNPNQGSGQGNGGAPPIFSNLSSLMVNVYKCHGNEATRMTLSYTCRLLY